MLLRAVVRICVTSVRGAAASAHTGWHPRPALKSDVVHPIAGASIRLLTHF